MTTPNNNLDCLAKEFRAAIGARRGVDAEGDYWLPSKEEVSSFCRRYLEVLFPVFYAPEEASNPNNAAIIESLELQLGEQIVRAIRFDCNCRGKLPPSDLTSTA